MKINKLILFKQIKIRIEILHEIEKLYNNTIKETTFNFESNGWFKRSFCGWGDNLNDNLKEFFDDKFKPTESHFERHRFMTQAEFIKEREMFSDKHGLKYDDKNKNYGLYCSNNEVSTFIVERLDERGMNITLNDIKQSIKYLHDYNYIKQVGCGENFKNQFYYYYDLTDKGRTVINTIDEILLTFTDWKRLLIIFGLAFAFIYGVLDVILRFYGK